MSRFEDLSGEILMAIFEYMNVEDVWTIFFNMNSRLNSLVFDSRLRLTADVSKIDKKNFDAFCCSLIHTNFSNLFSLILSNNYYRYPQINYFLSQTNFVVFQSLHALTLIDVNHDELVEVIEQIKHLPLLNYFHVNTHEIFRDKELINVTTMLFKQINISFLNISLHEKLQWSENEAIPLCNSEVLSLDFINADRLLLLLPFCRRLHSLSIIVDSRTSLPIIDEKISLPITIETFAQITYLRLCFRPFDISILDRLFSCFPGLRHFSFETLVYNTDYIRSPFWTKRLQQYFPLLERIRLVVRGWFVLKTNSNQLTDMKFDQTSIIDSYRFDRYWIDRAHKGLFQCSYDSSSAVLQIR